MDGHSDMYHFPCGEAPPISIVEATRICEKMAEAAEVGRFNPSDVYLMGGKPPDTGRWIFKQYTKLMEEYVFVIVFSDKTATLLKMRDHSGAMKADIILASFRLDGPNLVRVPNPPPPPDDPEDPFADESDSNPQGPQSRPPSGKPGRPASDDSTRINQASDGPVAPRLTLRASRLDGLPLHLMALDPDGIKNGAIVDLVPAFRKLGVPIPAGGSIVYDSGNGMLSRSLPPMAHDVLEEILANIYQFDNMQTACKAYYNLFKPMSGKDRIETALRTGFLPDPLISSLIDKIRLHMSVNPSDPSRDKKGFHPFPASEEKINGYKAVLETLLDRKIRDLEAHLKVVESLQGESPAPRQTQIQSPKEPTR